MISAHTALMRSIALLSCVLVPTLLSAQQIVRWTDAQGRVHYSDRAPIGQAAETVEVQKAPKQEAIENLPVLNSQPAAAPQSGHKYETIDALVAKRKAKEAELDSRAREKGGGQGNSYYEQSAAQKQIADDFEIANCKRSRETYCNKGAATIREKDNQRAADQYDKAMDNYDKAKAKGYNPKRPIAPAGR